MKSLLAKAITYDYPETIPVNVSVLPAMWMKHGKEFKRLAREYPQFLAETGKKITNFEETDGYLSKWYKKGAFYDEWGCKWENIEEGMKSIVTGHPIKSEEEIFPLKIPENRDGSMPHGFMYLRLLDLCGFEMAMMLFAEEGEALETLIAKVLEYNCRQVEARLPRMGEIVDFGDDLGMQKGIAIGAERFRKYLKPCFAKLYGIVKKKKPDTLIYMHTDGCVWEIMPDLMECGVDMINPQYRANGLENLVRVCRGKIPINLDLDRQLFPFATRSQIFDHVGECVESLYTPEGGLGLNVEFSFDIPLDVCAAVLEALEKYRFYKG